MGTRSDEARARETQKLLGYGFRYFETHKLYSAGDVLATEKVWLAKNDQLDVIVNEDIYMTLPRGARDDLIAEVVTPDYPEAPLKVGERVGTLTLKMDGEVVGEHPLVSSRLVEESGFVGRLFGKIKLFFVRLFA